MNKYRETFGVDIIQDVFDVHGSKSGHNQFKNEKFGFKSLLKHLPFQCLVVMESTGFYQLAQFLYKNEVAVSVVNPLSVKRFIKMKTALFLIVLTDGFEKFETGSQLCSYAGITPPYVSLAVV